MSRCYWQYYAKDGTVRTSKGMYLICDNGYLTWSTMICPRAHFDSMTLEGFFLTNLESVRKDVECTFVICRGIGGKYIPINMAQLAESQLLELATTVCCHPILPPLKTVDGSKIQVRQRHVILYGIPTKRISISSSIEVFYELLRYYEDQRIHSRTQIGTLTSLIVSELPTQTLLHAQPPKVDGNTSISNRYWSLWDRVDSTRCACVPSSFFSLETTLKLVIISLLNHTNIFLPLFYVKKASSIISQQAAQDNARYSEEMLESA